MPKDKNVNADMIFNSKAIMTFVEMSPEQHEAILALVSSVIEGCADENEKKKGEENGINGNTG